MTTNNRELLNLIRNNPNPSDALAKAIELITEFLKLFATTEEVPPAYPQAHD